MNSTATISHVPNFIKRLSGKCFINSMGPKKAAMVSGIFTTFEKTRLYGVHLYENNPGALLKIMGTTKHSGVKTEAANRLAGCFSQLGSKDALFAIDNMGPEFRTTALWKTNDGTILLYLACNSKHADVALAVIQRLRDRPFDVLNIFNSISKARSSHGGEAFGKVSTAAADSLLGLAGGNLLSNGMVSVIDAMSESCRIQALGKIAAPADMANLASNSGRPEVRMQMLGKLFSCNYAPYIAAVFLNTSYNDAKSKAIEMLGSMASGLADNNALGVLAMFHPESAIRASALDKLQDSEILVAVAMNGKHAESCLEAVHKLAAAKNAGSLWKIYKGAKKELRNAALDKLYLLTDKIREMGASNIMLELVKMSEKRPWTMVLEAYRSALGITGSVNELIKIAAKSKNPEIIRQAADKIAANGISPYSSGDALATVALFASSQKVRRHAMDIIADNATGAITHLRQGASHGPVSSRSVSRASKSFDSWDEVLKEVQNGTFHNGDANYAQTKRRNAAEEYNDENGRLAEYQAKWILRGL